MDNVVDAIEEGKIVRVSEEYAKREGLMILRKPEIRNDKYVITQKNKKEEVEKIGMEELRKPLHWKKKQVVAELVENFHWMVAKERKVRNLSRKQVAKDLSITENELKMIENGVLPYEDFVIINKIQKYFGINLRKDGKNFDQSMRQFLGETKTDVFTEKKETHSAGSGNDIEIID